MLDPATHQPTLPGGVGTLVLTPFAPYRESLVLLRYDSEDLIQCPTRPCGCKLDHLPAVGRLLGKRRLAVRHPRVGPVRAVAEALESVADVPLPARYSFHAHAGWRSRLRRCLPGDSGTPVTRSQPVCATRAYH
ncbi:MAG: hypothetical protein R2867_40160 [Caldilineaceae bacterium]